MKEVTYIVQCPHCLYDEEQILYSGMAEGQDSGVKCPNCEEKYMIIKKEHNALFIFLINTYHI